MANGAASDRWEEHLNDIAELYLEQDWELKDIAESLQPKLKVGPDAVRKRLRKWKIHKRLGLQGELRLLAQHLVRLQSQGQTVRFLRFGRPLDSNKVQDYLDRHDDVEPSSESLPAHLAIVPIDNADTAQSRDDSSSHTTGATQQDHTSKGKGRMQDSNTEAKSTHTYSEVGSDDDEPTGSSASLTFEGVEKALTDAKEWMQKQGMQETDIKEALLEPARLRQVAEKAQDKVTTDLGPLHVLAAYKKPELLRKMLAKGANVNDRGGRNWTAAHIAAETGHIEMLELLCEQPGIDLEAVDGADYTPLMRALLSGRPHCADLLLDHNVSVDYPDSDGWVGLHAACSKPNMEEVIARILAVTGNIDRQSTSGATALHIAFGLNNEDYARLLIAKGASLNVQNSDGRTPLHSACFEASKEILFELVKNEQADLTIPGNDGETVLHLVCQRSLPDITTIVLKRSDVDLDAPSAYGLTPLMLAVKTGCIDTVKLLLMHGANVGAVEHRMRTAFEVAVTHNQDEIASLLMDSETCPLQAQGKDVAKHQAEWQNKREARRVQAQLRGKKYRRLGDFSGTREQSRRQEAVQPPYTQPPGAMNNAMQQDIQTMVMQCVSELLAYRGPSMAPDMLYNGQYAGDIGNNAAMHMSAGQAMNVDMNVDPSGVPNFQMNRMSGMGGMF